MSGLSRNRENRWIWFVAGVVTALALVLGWLAWLAWLAWCGGQAGVEAVMGARLTPHVGDLVPRIPPDGPRLPDAPVPAPQ